MHHVAGKPPRGPGGLFGARPESRRNLEPPRWGVQSWARQGQGWPQAYSQHGQAGVYGQERGFRQAYGQEPSTYGQERHWPQPYGQERVWSQPRGQERPFAQRGWAGNRGLEMPFAKNYGQERSEESPFTQAERSRERVALDVELHLPNSEAVGFMEKLQGELRSIVLGQPLIDASKFLDAPRAEMKCGFLWQLPGMPCKPQAVEMQIMEPMEPMEPLEPSQPLVRPRFSAQRRVASPGLPEGECLALAPESSWMRPGEIFGREKPLMLEDRRFVEDVELQLRR